MFGKMVNNYFYGKSGKGDYRKDDLPRNRWQLFREMLRVRLSGLFRLNLMSAIIYLPLAYVLVILVNSLFGHLLEISEILANPDATPEMLALVQNSPQQVYSILFSGFVLLIPCILITGPVQAGMAYVTRNWARDEHAFVWSDFKDAVRDNWKQALGVSAITGVAPLLMLVSYQFYGGMAAGNLLFVIAQILPLGLGLAWFLALAFLYPMLVSYRMGFITLLRNSFLLALGRFPQTLAIRLIMLVPALLAAAVSFLTPYFMYAQMALMGYYLFIGNALARFVYASFSNSAFDRFINARIAGAQVNRGISPEDDEDEDDQETALPRDKRA